MPSFAVVSSDAVTESTVVRRPIEIPTDTNSRTQIADPSPAAHQNLSKRTFRSSQTPTGVVDATSAALSMRYMKATRSSMVAKDSPVWISNQVQPSVWGVRPGHAEMSIVNKKPPNP